MAIPVFEAGLAAAVVLVALWLARDTGTVGRWLVFASGLLVAGLMFLPSPVLRPMLEWPGSGAIREVVQALPWREAQVVHVVAFCWLGLVVGALRRGPVLPALGVLLLLAVAAEAVQAWVPTRSPRLVDVALNLSGVVAGWLVGAVAPMAAGGARRDRSGS